MEATQCMILHSTETAQCSNCNKQALLIFHSKTLPWISQAIINCKCPICKIVFEKALDYPSARKEVGKFL